MKILVLGSDGYIGYPLTLHLLNKGHEVSGLDNGSRRRRVEEIGGNSLTPITTQLERKNYLRSNYDNYKGQIDITLGQDSYGYIRSVLRSIEPDCIVHLAEQPSAPWSMIDANHAKATQHENILGTLDLLWAMREVCPEAHLIKLGTMGEYGTPNCDIPEGFVPYNCIHKGRMAINCPMSGLLFPRSPGSFYHLSKVHDTYNIKFARDTWGLRSTDIMQGVLFGVKVTGNESEDELTRFDYDEYFGTAINRFCAQALCDHPFTIYGKGGQTRGYLPLKDSIQCLTIAIDNPPNKGEYRTWNQFDTTFSINQLASIVSNQAFDLEIISFENHIENPRIEAEEHYYNPHHQTLFDLGYKPTGHIGREIRQLLLDLMPYKDRIIKDVIMPKTTWK
jgi:nucleoside-diphosphate-sugar epimerase